MSNTDEREPPKPLPADVINEILYGRNNNLRNTIDFINSSLRERDRIRRELRLSLYRNNLIHRLSGTADRTEIIEGIDGSYKIHRTLAFIAIAYGAVGYAPNHPNNDNKLRYNTFLLPSTFSVEGGRIAQGLMTFEEFYLAATSTSNIVIMDGSFISFLTRLNSALSYMNNNRNERIVNDAITRVSPNSNNEMNIYYRYRNETNKGMLLLDVLTSNINNNNKYIMAIPKGSQSSSAIDTILTRIQIPTELRQILRDHFTDRMLFTLILDENEYFYFYTSQRDLTNGRHEANLARGSDFRPIEADLVEEFYDREGRYSANGGFTFVYYRPQRWAPAYKIELPGKIDKTIIDNILNKLKESVIDPSILEHYEQYMADQLAREIGEATEAIISAALSQLSNTIGPDVVRLLLSTYRT